LPFISTLIASISAGLSSIAVGLGFSAAQAGVIASSILKFGASVLINAASAAIFGKKASAEDVGRELSQPSSAPAYRYVYGEVRATGTPVGTPVNGEFIYGCWLLNSRVSDLSSVTLYLDKREVVLTGDVFNLLGLGATATEDPFLDHVTAWVGRGAQTAPPLAFTNEALWEEGVSEDFWKTTDAWNGCTVIFLRIKAGAQGDRQERWPSSPPLVEVEGRWSKVYDVRDPSQDPDDQSTWAWSENHALCVRDVLTQNPIRQYQEDQLHDSFGDGADICDEVISLKSGGSESRYVCGGTVLFSDGEIEDQIVPMLVSGAADFVRVGGKLGYVAGAYHAPEVTLTYLLGDGFEFPDLSPGDELVNELRVTYLSPTRGYETAELRPWSIPGALSEDGGVPSKKTLSLPFCPSATQAMRVRKITGLRQRRQERISGGQLPPEAFNLIGGATATIELPEPYDVLDGVYEIESIHPGLDPLGESGEVALRLPAGLVKHSAAIYDWTAVTDEEDIYDEPYESARSGTDAPGAISVTTGGSVNIVSGGAIISRILFAFEPSASSGVTAYEWQFREVGGEYTTGGLIDGEVRDVSGDVFGYFTGVAATSYDLRASAIGPNGRSAWVEITGVSPVAVVTKNMFDKSKISPESVMTAAGAQSSTVSYHLSDFILVEPGTTYNAEGANQGMRYYTAFDAGKVAVPASGSDVGGTNITVPASGVYFYRVSIYATDLDTFQFEVGTEPTDYVPY
jgi:hypothetical protein